MVSPEELDRLRRVSAGEAESKDLVDIETVSVAGETPAERLESLLEQVKNPYCYLAGGTIVRISFSETNDHLEEKLRRYFMSLKNK